MQETLEKWSQSPGWLMSPGVGNGTPTLVFLSGEIHKQRSLAGYSTWGRKQSETNEHTENSIVISQEMFYLRN